MKKIIKPYKPDEKNYIFTEGIDYTNTGNNSIWGTGDKETLELLENTKIQGTWLNLGAGDGRYNLNLLKKAVFVIASDIDKSALSKLEQNIPNEYIHKFQTKNFNITKKFPFKDNSFDGVFCTGTLHLFSEEILQRIFKEINRILKSQGIIIFDFATDIKRVLPDGKFYFKESEPQYTIQEVTKFLKELLKNYKVKIIKSEVFGEEIIIKDLVYNFSCKFVLVEAEKEVFR